MEAQKKLLKVSGILYGIMGVFLLEAPFYGILLILFGIFIYSQSNEDIDTIYKNRVLYYMICILGIVNLVGSILLFTAMDEIRKQKKVNGMNAPPKVIYKVDKESRKIDLLLKLGVAMIFISGLLFATTSWDFIHNYVKAIALIVFGILFLCLSLFTESRLKLYRSSYMYWLLSMSLFILTIVGVLYFGIFSDYLTYSGSGRDLAYAITFLTGAGFSLTTYYKFPKKYLLFCCYGGIVLGIAYILSYMQLSQMMNVAIIATIVMITNIVDKKKGTIHTFSTILSYLLFAFIVIANSNSELEVLIACIMNILNLNYLTFINKKEEEIFINVLLTYILILIGLSEFSLLGDCVFIMIALSVSIYTLLVNGNVIPTRPITKKLNYVIYSFIMIILYLLTISKSNFMIPSTFVFIPIIHIVVNTLIKRGLFRVDEWKLANFMQPIILCELICGLVNYFIKDLQANYVLAIITFVFCILHLIYKESLDKGISYVLALIILVIAIMEEIAFPELIPSLLFVLFSLYLFTTSYLQDDESSTSKAKLVISYIVLLSSLYVPFVHGNVLDIQVYCPALVFIILSYIIALLLRDDALKKTSYLYIVLPLLTMIDAANINYVAQEILLSITKLYIMFLIIKFFVKNSLAKNIIIIIGLIISLNNVFFIENLYAGIYIGLLGLLTILVGFRKDEMFPAFVTGIIITILNIIYRLKDVWKAIPFWLYLLLGGLAIIGFVTYRELKKQKIKEEQTKSE